MKTKPVGSRHLNRRRDVGIWSFGRRHDAGRCGSFVEGRSGPQGRALGSWRRFQQRRFQQRRFQPVSYTHLDVYKRQEISCINKQGYPAWLREGADLRAFNHEGLFVDVGTPERLWEANRSLLAGELQVKHLQPFARFEERPGRVFVSQKAQVASDATLQGPCLVDDDAVIEEGARVGPFAVIGKGCVVERGTAVDHAVLQLSLIHI